MKGLKVCITVSKVPGGSMESWYNPNYPPEIGFNEERNITMGRMLHELLHMFSFNTYDSYRKQDYLVCEEYEIRVLTDLYMRHYFKSHVHEYQGMKFGNSSYFNYLAWLDEIIENDSYDIDLFAFYFKIYGAYCMLPFEDKKIKINDLSRYKPLLVGTLWFYGKIK